MTDAKHEAPNLGKRRVVQSKIAQMICGFKLRQGKRTDTDKAWIDAMETAGRILAALSPEAPAREGVVMAVADVPIWADGIVTDGENVAMAQKAEADHGGHYWAVDGGNGGLDWEPTHFISLDALTPRHEAPAEGAGERFTEGATLPDGAISGTDDGQTVWLESSTGGAHRLGIWGGLSLRFEEADGSSVVRDYEDVNLRARSSAPEAREEALGNLLAVIHGDGGHRALEVGTKQAALEAEKIVARLLSSAPEAREGEAVAWRCSRDHASDGNGQWFYYDGPPRPSPLARNVQPLYTHPAAPSADKLRELVGASEDILSALSVLSVAGKPIASLDTKLRDAINTLVPALAALKAETTK